MASEHIFDLLHGKPFQFADSRFGSETPEGKWFAFLSVMSVFAMIQHRQSACMLIPVKMR